jgi:hypothetical protein
MATGGNRVVELDCFSNTCIRQKLSLKEGRYLLEYDWAAREGKPVGTAKMSVHINNEAVQEHTPFDYQVQHGRYAFNVHKQFPTVELQFCGNGPSDGFGVILDKVRIFDLNQCN